MRADDADVLRLHVPRAARVARLVAEYGVPPPPPGLQPARKAIFFLGNAG